MKEKRRGLETATIRDVILIGLGLLFAFKLLQAQWVIDPVTFPVQEAASLVLAVFAIGLSVQFYLKASEVSERFHNDIYQFTKDSSELLGRIQAGFGEQLRHLDQGYVYIRDRLDSFSPSDRAVDLAQGELDAEERQIGVIDTEFSKLIGELTERAQLKDQEREQFEARLTELSERRREAELDAIELREEINMLRAQLEPVEAQRARNRWITTHRRASRFMHQSGIDALRTVDGALADRFQAAAEGFPDDFLQDLEELGYGYRRHLTPEGIDWLARLVERVEGGDATAF